MMQQIDGTVSSMPSRSSNSPLKMIMTTTVRVYKTKEENYPR